MRWRPSLPLTRRSAPSSRPTAVPPGRPPRASDSRRRSGPARVAVVREGQPPAPFTQVGAHADRLPRRALCLQPAPVSYGKPVIRAVLRRGGEGQRLARRVLRASFGRFRNPPGPGDGVVTGLVNQLGRVQAVGGINDKIEGFLDACVARGLDGPRRGSGGCREVPHLPGHLR